MCVSFHPLNPSIVAAGSFNGEVFVWDTEPVEYKFFSSGIGDYFHRDPVTKVAWVYDLQSADYNIASISMDGKILFWRLKDKLAFPVEGYEMHLPLTDGIKPRNTTACSPVLGGKTMAVNTLDKTTRAFILGSEGGLVARCFANANATSRASEFKGEKKWTATAARLLSNLPPSKLQSARRQVEAHASAKRSKDVTLATVYEARLNPASLFPNALDFLFDAHLGPVYDATFSPFRKNTFLTASADGTLRLYSTRQRACLLSMDVSPSSAYLYAVQWSRTRPAVFATASEDGHVYVFDLTVDHVNPVATLSGKLAPVALNATVATTSESGAPMFALDFNPRQRNFLAAGDGAGVVHIWKLSWQLATLQTRETEVLEALEGKNG